MHFQFTAEFWIQLIFYMIATVTFLNKLATKSEVKEKISSTYKRLDDIKNYGEITFVRKDICCEMHKQSKDEIKRIDEDAKNFRHDIRNSVQAIFCKFDDVKDQISEMKAILMSLQKDDKK